MCEENLGAAFEEFEGQLVPQILRADICPVVFLG